MMLASSTAARAQGCVMCYNTAAAAKAETIQALRSGILILLVPVLLMFVGIFAVAYLERNAYNGQSGAEDAAAGDFPTSLLAEPALRDLDLMEAVPVERRSPAA